MSYFLGVWQRPTYSCFSSSTPVLFLPRVLFSKVFSPFFAHFPSLSFYLSSALPLPLTRSLALPLSLPIYLSVPLTHTSATARVTARTHVRTRGAYNHTLCAKIRGDDGAYSLRWLRAFIHRPLLAYTHIYYINATRRLKQRGNRMKS